VSRRQTVEGCSGGTTMTSAKAELMTSELLSPNEHVTPLIEEQHIDFSSLP